MNELLFAGGYVLLGLLTGESYRKATESTPGRRVIGWIYVLMATFWPVVWISLLFYIVSNWRMR